MLLNESIDDILLQRSKDLDILLGIVVADIQPELVELIWCGALGVEPDVSRLGLTELLTVTLSNQWAGQCESLILVAKGTTDELRTRGNVTPLVVTAQLQLTVLMLVEVEEVVALQQLVGELGERQTVASRTVQALLNAILGHHIVHGDVLTHLTGKVEEGEVLHPVVVIDHDGSIGFLRLEVEELRHLFLDTLLVVAEGIVVVV